MTESRTWPNVAVNGGGLFNGSSPATGISYLRSRVKISDITDGTSNTYLLGEKYLSPDYYLNGMDGADNESMYCGYDNDNHRTTYYDGTHPDHQPMQDMPGYAGNCATFGSGTLSVATWHCATARCGRSTTRSIRRPTAAWATARTAKRSTPRSGRCVEMESSLIPTLVHVGELVTRAMVLSGF